MPIIPLKDNPPSRFPNYSILESDSTWWVAKVKSRQEKALAWALYSMQIEYYLPLYKNVIKRKDNGKKRTSLIPLFSSYLPIAIQKSDLWKVQSNNHVHSIITVQNQIKFREELNRVFIADNMDVSIIPADGFVDMPGKAIEIISGPFNGLKGIVQTINGADRVRVSIENLGVVSISVDSIQTIESAGLFENKIDIECAAGALK